MSEVAMMPEPLGPRSRLEFHEGEAFCRVAGEYPTVTDVILEQVQNALDADATTIWITMNRKTRNIAIRDNGNGVSRKDFDGSLSHVCHSEKVSGKLGRFGIGLISPLGKCARFTFTSTPMGNDQGYNEWTFVTADIRAMARDVHIPRQKMENRVYDPTGKRSFKRGLQATMWRTQVEITSYSTDKLISRISSIDALAEAITDRFGAAMQRNKVSLNLKFTDERGASESREGVRAKQFVGRPLKELVIHNPDAGNVTFKLYLAPKTTKGQHGKILVGEADNDYRFAFNLFKRSADGILPSEVADGLSSGIFEGEILGEKVKLHVSRKSFEKDDAFMGFCLAPEEWFRRQGAKHLNDAREERRETRYQELGLESLKQIEQMLKLPRYAELCKVLNGFSMGSVGKGHAPRPDEIVVGAQKEPALTTTNVQPTSGNDSVGAGRESEPTAKPDHQPYTVTGPRGERRTLVKRDSIGLQFSHATMDGSDRLWELDLRHGILHFNVNHPTWVECDTSDRRVRQLQEAIAINALTIHSMPPDEEPMLRMAFDESMRSLTYLFQESPAFNYLRKRAEV